MACAWETPVWKFLLECLTCDAATDRTALFGGWFLCLQAKCAGLFELSGIVARDLRTSMGESQFFENVYFLSARDQGRSGFDSAAFPSGVATDRERSAKPLPVGRGSDAVH